MILIDINRRLPEIGFGIVDIKLNIFSDWEYACCCSCSYSCSLDIILIRIE